MSSWKHQGCYPISQMSCLISFGNSTVTWRLHDVLPRSGVNLPCLKIRCTQIWCSVQMNNFLRDLVDSCGSVICETSWFNNMLRVKSSRMIRRFGKTEFCRRSRFSNSPGASTIAHPLNILRANMWGDEVRTMKWSNEKHAGGAASVFDLRTFAEANTLLLKCKFRI